MTTPTRGFFISPFLNLEYFTKVHQISINDKRNRI
jgi:hypothetical protein